MPCGQRRNDLDLDLDLDLGIEGMRVPAKRGRVESLRRDQGWWLRQELRERRPLCHGSALAARPRPRACPRVSRAERLWGGRRSEAPPRRWGERAVSYTHLRA